MPIIPSIKRLVKEDFQKEYQPLIEKVGFATNSAFESIINALNGGLNFENLSLPYKTISVQVDAGGVPMQNTSFTANLGVNKKLVGIQVIKVENLTTPGVPPTGGVTVSFSLNNSSVTITHITGLIPNNKYNLTLLLLG